MRISLSYLLILLTTGLLAQGSFDPAVGKPGCLAIFKDSSIIKSWASSIDLHRGYIDIANKPLGTVDYGKDDYALGKSSPRVVSLGDSGIATLSYNGVVKNGPGADFCVFENSFDDNFLELAFVEVSSDGTNFVRFDAYSETDDTHQKGPFDLLEATNLHNLAGKHRGQWGTPFDLEELKGTPGLNVDSITHIRIVDVIGSVDSTLGNQDAKGRMINDPYPTDFENGGLYNGGFDLDAVGLIHYEGEIFLSDPEYNNFSSIRVFPNPASSSISIEGFIYGRVEVYNLSGQKVQEHSLGMGNLDVSELPVGVYQLRYLNEEEVAFGRFVKK